MLAPRRAVAAGLLAAALLVVAACSGTGSASSPGSAPAPSAGGSPTAARIQALTSAVQAAQHATFKAVYSLTTGSGAAQTVTLAQKPPKSLFSTNDGLVVNDGATTYFCSLSGGHDVCISENGGANPLAPLAELFSPASAVIAMQQATGNAVAFSSQSFAGQPATCVSLNGAAQAGKYCVTKNGILAYSGSGTGSFTLTSFSASVPDSEFALPPGAETVTIPGPGG